MSSKEALTEISEFMDVLQEVGKDCLIKDGHLTVSISYDASNPDLEREKLAKLLNCIIQQIPHPFALPRNGDWLEFVQIMVDLPHQRIEIGLEPPSVIFPSRKD